MHPYRLFLATTTTCALLVASACVGPSGGDAPDHTGERRAAITDGVEHYGHPSVGLLQDGTSGKVQVCTATLIGKRTVLTAAHCITAGKQHVFEVGGQNYLAASTIVHEQWNPNINTYPNDVALVILASEPPGITPSIITKRKPTVGQQITLVGFGTTTFTGNDLGQKRMAKNSIATLTDTRFSFTGTGNGVGNTCKGDSGGPAFSTFGGREELVGVTSAGVGSCGTRGWDTRVDVYHGWIAQNANGDVHQPGGGGDSEPPTVKITAPTDRSTVGGRPTVEVDASDNVGVAEVELRIDGAKRESKTSAPWTFTFDLATGTHTLEVVASDASGNSASDKVTVTVGQSDKLAYGVACEQHAQCASGICAAQGSTKFCTEKCTPGGTACPGAKSQCVDAGGAYVCIPENPGTKPPGVDEISGGCAVGAGSSAADVPWVLLLFCVMVITLRRRRDQV